MKRVVVRLTPKAEEVYRGLNDKAPNSKQEELLLNVFLQKVELIKRNFQYGQPIAKKLIPPEYKTNSEPKIFEKKGNKQKHQKD